MDEVPANSLGELDILKYVIERGQDLGREVRLHDGEVGEVVGDGRTALEDGRFGVL